MNVGGPNFNFSRGGYLPPPEKPGLTWEQMVLLMVYGDQGRYLTEEQRNKILHNAFGSRFQA